MQSKQINFSDKPNWDAVADAWCAAWTSDTGQGDFTELEPLYAPDSDVPIFDTIEPLEGFRSFEQMRAEIYSDGALETLTLRRTSPVETKFVAGGSVAITTYRLQIEYGFPDRDKFIVQARMTQAWEYRNGWWLIVLEHPSSILSVVSS